MGESMPPPEYIASEALHWQMIKEGNWKYVTHTVDSRELLYNLESDPYEYRDISQNPNYLDKLKHMRSLLKKWLNETPPFPNQRHPLTKEWYRGHINDWFKNGRHVNLDVWPDENGLAITSRKD
jgi:arylsulfatase A-like enzyme